MSTTSSFKVRWLRHDELACEDWDVCPAGGSSLQRIDEAGRYCLAVLAKPGAWVVSARCWDRRIDTELYRSYTKECCQQGVKTPTPENRLTVDFDVLEHDRIFQKEMNDCPFMDDCYYTVDDAGYVFATVEGDKVTVLRFAYS